MVSPFDPPLCPLFRTQAQAGTVASAASVTRLQHGAWVEYRVVTALTAATTFVVTTGSPATVAIFARTDYNNYPLFYDALRPVGYGGSGRYTCYMRHLGYIPWSYYTGSTNPGVIANVYTMPYSIGYSVLSDAMNSFLPMASMVNRAGQVVAPSSYTVDSAVMDKGGNLDANFNAVLVDSSSFNAWPMSGTDVRQCCVPLLEAGREGEKRGRLADALLSAPFCGSFPDLRAPTPRLPLSDPHSSFFFCFFCFFQA